MLSKIGHSSLSIVNKIVDKIEPHYQPIISLCHKKGGVKVIGMEILSRLHGNCSVYPPSYFMKYFSTSTTLNILTSTIIKKSLLHIEEMPIKPSFVSVNLCGSQLHTGSDIVSELLSYKDELSKHNIRLTIEIGESYQIEAHNDIIVTLNALRDYDIDIAIDDYGKQFSTTLRIASLKRVDKIKIDKSIIDRVPGCLISEMLITHVFDLAIATNGIVIAEGVENKKQADYIVGLGDVLLQGHYFSKPLGVELLNEYIYNQSQYDRRPSNATL